MKTYILTAAGNNSFICDVKQLFNSFADACRIANNLLLSGNYNNIKVTENV